jgi:indole-3-glycerol phosphate synthase
VLLIVVALDQPTLTRLLAAASEYELEALVEVHDEEELGRAQDANARLIGINNRNLHTFEVDLVVTERLAPRAAEHAVVVGESGIFTAADVERLAASGVNAVLVGESLITASDRGAAVRALTGILVRA